MDTPAPAPRSSLDDQAKHLRMAATRLVRLMREHDDDGLGATAGAALATIAKHGPIVLQELAHRERIDPSVAAEAVERLSAAGFVTGDEAHTATTAGFGHLAATRKRRNDWLASRLAGLSAAELSTLDAAVGLLTRINVGSDNSG